MGGSGGPEGYIEGPRVRIGVRVAGRTGGLFGRRSRIGRVQYLSVVVLVVVAVQSDLLFVDVVVIVVVVVSTVVVVVKSVVAFASMQEAM